MKIDQNTGISLFVVGSVASGMFYGAVMVGQFKERLEKLDAVQIEKRLTAIETTLNLISRRQQASMFKTPPATLIEAAPR